VELEIHDIDAYVGHRVAGLRRRSIKGLTTSLRAFVRYLHGSGRTRRDLSSSVTSPTLYTYEGIPSALSPQDVHNVLVVTRQDRTAAGLRDYAILMLLATYGLRAGEIASLRLDDIDWPEGYPARSALQDWRVIEFAADARARRCAVEIPQGRATVLCGARSFSAAARAASPVRQRLVALLRSAKPIERRRYHATWQERSTRLQARSSRERGQQPALE